MEFLFQFPLHGLEKKIRTRLFTEMEIHALIKISDGATREYRENKGEEIIDRSVRIWDLILSAKIEWSETK